MTKNINKNKKIKILEAVRDPVFKYLLLSKKNTNWKSELIYRITDIPIEELNKATYTSQELKSSKQSNKVLKTDIIITVGNNIISLEMNKDYYEGLFIKNDMYSSRLKAEQLDEGNNYLSSKKIVEINLDNFHKFKGNKLKYEFMMREKDTHEIEHDYFKSYHIDLKYITDKCYNEDELSENDKRIIELLKIFVINDYDELESLRGDKNMDEAIDELEKLSQDEKIIGLYDANKVEEMVLNTRLLDAEKKGIEQGIEKIAKTMLERNMNIDDISSITGLSIEEIKKIKL